MTIRKYLPVSKEHAVSLYRTMVKCGSRSSTASHCSQNSFICADNITEALDPYLLINTTGMESFVCAYPSITHLSHGVYKNSKKKKKTGIVTSTYTILTVQEKVEGMKI